MCFPPAAQDKNWCVTCINQRAPEQSESCGGPEVDTYTSMCGLTLHALSALPSFPMMVPKYIFMHTQHLGVITCHGPCGHHLSGASAQREDTCLMFVKRSALHIQLLLLTETPPQSERKQNHKSKKTPRWSSVRGKWSRGRVLQEESFDDSSQSGPFHTPPSTASSAADMRQTLLHAAVGLKCQMGKIMHADTQTHTSTYSTLTMQVCVQA